VEDARIAKPTTGLYQANCVRDRRKNKKLINSSCRPWSFGSERCQNLTFIVAGGDLLGAGIGRKPGFASCSRERAGETHPKLLEIQAEEIFGEGEKQRRFSTNSHHRNQAFIENRGMELC
jgi:hypothetical protein